MDMGQRIADRPADLGDLGGRESRAAGALRQRHIVD
jgi:hypothetical protein